MDQKTGDTRNAAAAWPIVSGKDHTASSVFRPEALLREARRQKGLPLVAVPRVCELDPDGDVVRYLRRTGSGRIREGWACYHTDLLTFDLDGAGEAGIFDSGDEVRGSERPQLLLTPISLAQQFDNVACGRSFRGEAAGPSRESRTERELVGLLSGVCGMHHWCYYFSTRCRA